MPQLTFKRYETKYLLTAEQRARLEALLQNAMVPDEHGASTVRNVYYDTPTALLARRSAEHPFYKEKVRMRCYGQPHPFDPVFVEIKKKADGVVYKRRAQLAPADAVELLSGRGRPQTQIEREIDWTCRRYEGLRATAYLAYDRVAFYSPSDRDFRVTLDQNVRVRWDDVRLDGPDEGEQILDAGLSILEVKTCGGMPLWLVGELGRMGLSKTSVSKYGRAWQLRGIDQVIAANRAQVEGVRDAATAAEKPASSAEKPATAPAPTPAHLASVLQAAATR